VLEPLFAGITLDPSLSERFAFADFTWGAMSHGSMVVPREGIGAVPNQLAQRLEKTKVILNAVVSEVTASKVTVNDEQHVFDQVVLAVPQHVASSLLPSLLGEHEPVERCTSTVVFRAPRPPFRQPRLLLNETWGLDGNMVLHVHVPTNLHSHPQNEHWVAATLVGEAALHPDEKAVQAELATWFGDQVHQWTHTVTTTVRHALPHIDPSVHERIASQLDVDGILVVGDHRTHPSVQGALASAERALAFLDIPLPRR